MSNDDSVAAEVWVDSWHASIQERADQARLLRERLDAIKGAGWDRVRLVKVTVAASGALTDVELHDRILRQPVSLTRKQILEAAQAAQLDLAQKAAKVTAKTIGMRHPTADAVVRSFTQRLSAPGSDDADR